MPDIPRVDAAPDPPLSRSNPFASWTRRGLCALAWMPPFAMVLLVVPLFLPMFRRLEERGDLAPAIWCLFASVEFNMAFGYLPSVLGFVFVVAVTEFFVRRSPIQQLAFWIALVFALAFVTAVLLCFALMLPVYRSGTPIR
jgi:hypothetical protein